MLPEAKDIWVHQARAVRKSALDLSILLDEMKDFATANDLSGLIAESTTTGQWPKLIGTDMDLADVLAFVQLSIDATIFFEFSIVPGGLSRRLFLRKLG